MPSSVAGILASLAAVGFEPETLVQFALVAAMGGGVGTIIGRRITAIELPQMVAALHSVVGLAAVLTSIGSVLSEIEHPSTLHLVTAYLGVLIGRFSNRPWIVSSLYIIGRRCYFHRLCGGILEASWSDVVETFSSPRETSHQRISPWRKCLDNGCFCHDGTDGSGCCCSISRTECPSKLH